LADFKHLNAGISDSDNERWKSEVMGKINELADQIAALTRQPHTTEPNPHSDAVARVCGDVSSVTDEIQRAWTKLQSMDLEARDVSTSALQEVCTNNTESIRVLTQQLSECCEETKKIASQTDSQLKQLENKLQKDTYKVEVAGLENYALESEVQQGSLNLAHFEQNSTQDSRPKSALTFSQNGSLVEALCQQMGVTDFSELCLALQASVEKSNRIAVELLDERQIRERETDNLLRMIQEVQNDKKQLIETGDY